MSLLGLLGRLVFREIRSREDGPGGDPHAARALEDSFKQKRDAPARQIAGEDCAQCEENIVFETDGTACGVCDALLHRKRCAKRHVCANARAANEPAQPYRE